MAESGGPISHKGYKLERDVAAIYQTLGAKVEQEISLAGNWIDILVTEKTSSGSEIRSAIECKAYAAPVAADIVNRVGGLAFLLKKRGLIDRAVLVSTNGFTNKARAVALEHNIELITLDDLQQRVRGREEDVQKAAEEIGRAHFIATTSTERPKRVFVIMPFAKEFDDVYLLGVREVAEKLGLVVERADDIEHNEQILDVIQQSIRTCDIVVADTTYQNPNVFYEVGYSHSAGVPTILISRAEQQIPFDLRAMNHIFYETIVDLREKLENASGQH
jgi:hypothetical protein